MTPISRVHDVSLEWAKCDYDNDCRRYNLLAVFGVKTYVSFMLWARVENRYTGLKMRDEA